MTWNTEKLGFEPGGHLVPGPCGPCRSSRDLPLFRSPRPRLSQPRTPCLVPTVQHGGGLRRTLRPFPEHVAGGSPCVSFLTTSSLLGGQLTRKAAELCLHKPHTQFPQISRGLCWTQRHPYSCGKQAQVHTPGLGLAMQLGKACGHGSAQQAPPARPVSSQSVETRDPWWRVSSARRQEARAQVPTLPLVGLRQPLNSAPGQLLRKDQQRTIFPQRWLLPGQGPPFQVVGRASPSPLYVSMAVEGKPVSPSRSSSGA